MRRHIVIALIGLASAAVASPLKFDFKDPKGVNNAAFKLDAPLEAVSGSASGVAGTVVFDPAEPGATTGTITVAANTLMVPNSMMKEHMHSPMWLDVAKYPEISFAVKSLANVKTDGNITTADATGNFKLKDVSKEVTVPVKITYLADKLGQRVPNLKGDLLVIRARFEIKRGDFNINPGKFEDKVSDTIEINLSIAGASVR
jgi:polyisoprenoid-binding protein YceI